MSDADARAAERQFRSTGDPGDEAAWLHARVRAGELDAGQVQVAARCGHEASWRVLGAAAPEVAETLPDLLVQLEGGAPLARAVAAAMPGLIEFERPGLEASYGCDAEEDGLVAHLLEVFEAWIVTPERSQREAVRQARRDLRRYAGERPWLARNCLDCTAAGLIAGTGDVADWLWDPFPWGEPKAHLPLQALLRCAQHEVAEWALGYRDAVRERVTRREARAGSRA